MFQDRKDAGKKLARKLDKYKDKDALVLAIPRGGVEVGIEVAKHLNAKFSLLVTRKLPYPENPEAGFGAIAEDGSIFIFGEDEHRLSQETVDRIIEEQTEEAGRRVNVLREGRPLPQIRGRTVILVDDGIAMGSTMKASILLCRKQKAKKIVIAVPVSARSVSKDIEKMVDELYVLSKPLFFNAVAQVYWHWHDVKDEEVLNLLRDHLDEQGRCK